jgi:hypothetical protein
MKCPHLNVRIQSCRANRASYSPSEFQIEEYCTNASHRKCPLRASRPSAGANETGTPGRGIAMLGDRS